MKPKSSSTNLKLFTKKKTGEGQVEENSASLLYWHCLNCLNTLPSWCRLNCFDFLASCTQCSLAIGYLRDYVLISCISSASLSLSLYLEDSGIYDLCGDKGIQGMDIKA